MTSIDPAISLSPPSVGGKEASAASQPKFLSLDEVQLRLSTISEDDMAKIELSARILARTLPGLDADELLSDAYVAVLSGRRRWPRSYPALHFLAGREGVFRSILDAKRKKVAKEARRRASILEAIATVFHAETDHDLRAKSSLSFMLAAFPQDPHARSVIRGLAEGYDHRENQEKCGLDPTSYASKIRLIRRRLSSLRDEGAL